MDAWWNHEGRDLYQMLTITEQTQLEIFTGCMPILLNTFVSLPKPRPIGEYQRPSSQLPYADDGVTPTTWEILCEQF